MKKVLLDVVTGTGTSEDMLTSESLPQQQAQQQMKPEHDIDTSLYYSSAESGKSSCYVSHLSHPSITRSTHPQFPVAESAASSLCQLPVFVRHQPSIVDVIISSGHQLSPVEQQQQQPLKIEMKREMDDEPSVEGQLAAELEEL